MPQICAVAGLTALAARPAEKTGAQRSRLALLADAVFTSMDLALRRTDLRVARGACPVSAIETYFLKLLRSFVVPHDVSSGT